MCMYVYMFLPVYAHIYIYIYNMYICIHILNIYVYACVTHTMSKLLSLTIFMWEATKFYEVFRWWLGKCQHRQTPHPTWDLPICLNSRVKRKWSGSVASWVTLKQHYTTLHYHPHYTTGQQQGPSTLKSDGGKPASYRSGEGITHTIPLYSLPYTYYTCPTIHMLHI